MHGIHFLCACPPPYEISRFQHLKHRCSLVCLCYGAGICASFAVVYCFRCCRRRWNAVLKMAKSSDNSVGGNAYPPPHLSIPINSCKFSVQSSWCFPCLIAQLMYIRILYSLKGCSPPSYKPIKAQSILFYSTLVFCKVWAWKYCWPPGWRSSLKPLHQKNRKHTNAHTGYKGSV